MTNDSFEGSATHTNSVLSPETDISTLLSEEGVFGLFAGLAIASGAVRDAEAFHALYTSYTHDPEAFVAARKPALEPEIASALEAFVGPK